MNINSKEYWDERFDGNWLDFAGDKQTVFFAELLCRMLPQNLVNEIREKEYSVCDMGCALGEAVPVFCRKFAVDVDGMDFSEEAIKKASETYPEHKFWVGDLTNLNKDKMYDVIICSNVLEHFINPWKIAKNLSEIANKYMILMFPYKETLKIDEHMYHFSEQVIPMKINEFSLISVNTVDGKSFEESYYPDQQVLLVYKKNCENMVLLSEVTKGSVEAQLRKDNYDWEKRLDILKEELGAANDELREQISGKEKEIEILKAAVHEKDLVLQNETLRLENEKANLESEKVKLENEKTQLTTKIVELEKEIENKANVIKEAEEFRSENSGNLNAIDRLNRTIVEKDNIILQARSLCLNINSKTSYKILCAFSRFVKQFLVGSIAEKKKFLGICKRCITRESSEFSKNDGYNMVLNIANILDSSNAVEIPAQIIENTEISCEAVMSNEINPNEINSITEKCLQQKYNKSDIIIFSVINYEFRYQRPQHFATRFAENGHRVFYINANFVNKECIKNVSENLYVVDFYNEKCNAIYYAPDCSNFETWFKEKMDNLINLYAIRDAITILDYPNWINGAEYLRKSYGFKIAVDYMDDFTGFLGTTTNALKDNCIHMLKTSDMVVASSNFLHDIAIKYANKTSIVRNGTEVEHFYKAFEMENHKQRPVIGYYGAVSHWFAWEKVCYVAKNMPEADIVIIGEVTEHRDKLEKYSNIKLLGEMKYEDLPKHLAYFDVCLIPFDTSTDLIKATNPVKFYEYLSAGKRVVATEIPELEPFKDEYVYMSNDNQKFLEYVQLCLAHKDKLRNPEECITFARENDWQKRYEKFAEACMEAVPKVSIVVLTYNNLKLNKYCVDSILNKTAYSNYELIILDNCSTDGTVEYLTELEKKQNPHVKIIINKQNSGFAGGNNIAIDQSTGDYVMLLNNDTVVTRGWLTNAVKHMENNPKYGMCGAVTNSIGNEAMIGVNYKNLKELDNFAFQYTRQHNNEIYTDVDRLAMFCTLIRKEIMNQYGKLDENYQVGMFEDDDYAQVVERAGYSLIIAEDVFVHHVNNASFKKLQSEEYKRIFEKNKEYFEKKWSVKWKMPKYRDGVTAVINEGMMVVPVEGK